MMLAFRIARKYFFSKKRGKTYNLVNIISAISVLGYTVGTMALIIVLSVFNGFETMFSAMYTNFDPDLQVVSTVGKTFEDDTTKWQKLQRIQGIYLASKVLEENVLLAYDGRQSIAKAKGVDSLYSKLTQLDSAVVEGQIQLQYNNMPFAALGQEVAWKLAIDPNDPFTRLDMYVPAQGSVDVLQPEANFKVEKVFPSAIFSVHQEVDQTYVIVSIAFLQQLLEKPNSLSSIDINLMPEANVQQVTEQIKDCYGEGIRVKNRYEQREAFYKIMKSEKMISYMILLFILFIAAANSIASLYMLMLEKKRDIRLLAHLGMRPKTIFNVFLTEGLLIAMAGAFTGIVLGVSLCVLQEQYGFIKLGTETAFIVQDYPVQVRMSDILLVLSTVLLLGAATAYYPAKKASNSAYALQD